MESEGGPSSRQGKSPQPSNMPIGLQYVGSSTHYAPTTNTRDKVVFSVCGPAGVTLEEEHPDPGSLVVDLVFPVPSKVREVVFRNYYTAWMTILVKTRNYTADVPCTGTSDGDAGLSLWAMSIPHRSLMPYPHLETGSQDVVSISYDESLVEWDDLVKMRLILRQPSTAWKTFHVEELNLFTDCPRFPSPPFERGSLPGPTSPSHCDQNDELFKMFIKQTVESVHNENDSESNEGFAHGNDHMPPYEFPSITEI